MERAHLLARLRNMDCYGRMPLVELAGCERVLIENHAGVLTYSPEKIAVKVNYGCLQIDGENMMLAEMRREQLVVIGRIFGVSLHRR